MAIKLEVLKPGTSYLGERLPLETDFSSTHCPFSILNVVSGMFGGVKEARFFVEVEIGFEFVLRVDELKAADPLKNTLSQEDPRYLGCWHLIGDAAPVQKANTIRPSHPTDATVPLLFVMILTKSAKLAKYS